MDQSRVAPLEDPSAVRRRRSSSGSGSGSGHRSGSHRSSRSGSSGNGGSRRGRSRRGFKHRIRKIVSRKKYRRYSEFMGKGSSPRQIAKRYEQQQRRKKRLVIGGIVFAGLAVMGGAMADAYLQAIPVLEDVRLSGEALKQVRANLIRGKLPPEDAFVDAAKAINEAQDKLDTVRPTWRFARLVPFAGLPVSATERLVNASRHELTAALQAKDLLEQMLGQTIQEAEAEAEAARERRELLDQADTNGDGHLDEDERKRYRDKGGILPGDEKPAEEPADPDALLADGKLNLTALNALMPAVQGLEASLQAAEDEIAAIGGVPFVQKAEDLRADLIGEIEESRRLGERALAGLNFIPAFMGGNEAKNYLLLFADSGYLRGTGGAYFAYAEINVKNGSLSLVNQGPIIDLDRYRNEDVPIPEDNWYLQPDTAISKVAVRMNNLNWDPHFPNTAPVAADIYKTRTAGKEINGVIKPEGRVVDGVFQIDITGVAYLVDAIGPIAVDSWPYPVGGGNLEQVALIESYLEFSEGGDDAGDSGAERKAFNEDLVEATWRALQEPDDLVRTVFQLSRALAERHMQVWVRAEKQQTFFEDLGWAGAVKDTPGDYVYVVDQNLGDDTLDVFAAERVNYDVVIEDDGDLNVTATVSTTNFVDETMPYPILDNNGPATKKTYVNLYAPENAELQSITYQDRFQTIQDTKQLPPIKEAGRVVFSAPMSIKAHETGSLIFKYRVPKGLLDEDGELYRLTVQRQPRYVDQSINLTVTFPEGWDAHDYDDEIWTVDGNTAEAFVEAFEADQVFELRFYNRRGARPAPRARRLDVANLAGLPPREAHHDLVDEIRRHQQRHVAEVADVHVLGPQDGVLQARARGGDHERVEVRRERHPPNVRRPGRGLELAEEPRAGPELAGDAGGRHVRGAGTRVRSAQRHHGVDPVVAAQALHVIAGHDAAQAVADQVDPGRPGRGEDLVDPLGQARRHHPDVAVPQGQVQVVQVREPDPAQGPAHHEEPAAVVEVAVHHDDRRAPELAVDVVRQRPVVLQPPLGHALGGRPGQEPHGVEGDVEAEPHHLADRSESGADAWEPAALFLEGAEVLRFQQRVVAHGGSGFTVGETETSPENYRIVIRVGVRRQPGGQNRPVRPRARMPATRSTTPTTTAAITQCRPRRPRKGPSGPMRDPSRIQGPRKRRRRPATARV